MDLDTSVCYGVSFILQKQIDVSLTGESQPMIGAGSGGATTGDLRRMAGDSPPQGGNGSTGDLRRMAGDSPPQGGNGDGNRDGNGNSNGTSRLSHALIQYGIATPRRDVAEDIALSYFYPSMYTQSRENCNT